MTDEKSVLAMIALMLSLYTYKYLMLFVLVFSFLNARGEGFEAFFTNDGFLVLAVHTKKEFLTTTVTSAPFNDQEWVS